MWVFGVRASLVEVGGPSACIVDFALVLMRFLLICCEGGMFPQSLGKLYFKAECCPWSGVYVGRGRGEQLRQMYRINSLCAHNYLG
jgi:hypothetical protein